MPDWVGYVRRNLPLDNLTRERADDLVEEVARQLEDFYREARGRGLSETEAERYARNQIRDWESLTSDLYRTNGRTRKTTMNQKLEQMTEEATQPGRSPSWLANFAGELRADIVYGVRMLARTPGFTVIAVLTLALGIGANATIFTMVNSMILRPLPFEDSHQIIRLYNTNEKRGWSDINSSYADYLDFKANTKTLSDLAAFTRQDVNFSTGERADRVRAGISTPGLYELLRMKPILGRTLLSSDQELSDERVVMLGEELWRQSYGGRRDIIGETAILNDRAYTVIGGVPDIPGLGSLWIPLRATENTMRRSNHFLAVVGRMKPGVTIQEANTELSGIAGQLAVAYPDSNADFGLRTVFLKDALVDREDRAIVFSLFGLVSIVLLLACANVANLLLSRAGTRSKEIAVRSTLGAGRSRLLRQLLTESAVLGAMGGVLGLLFAYWGVQLLLMALPPYVPRLDEIRMDSWVILYTLGVSLLTSMFFGLAPAFQLARPDLQEVMKEGGRSSNPARARLRNTLAVAQVAVAMVLLVSSGLFMKGFAKVAGLDWGFRTEQLLTAETTLPSVKYASGEQRAAFYRDMLEEIRKIPVVEQAGITSRIYVGQGTLVRGFIRAGEPIPEPGEAPAAIYYAVSPEYLPLMDVPLRAGRHFRESDEREFPKVVVVNETLASRVWPNGNPIGKQIRFYHDETSPRTVVGVVADTLHGDFDSGIRPQAYVPHRQTAWGTMNFVIRTSGDPEAARLPLQNIFRRTHPDLPLSDVWTMEYRVSRQLQGFRVISFVLTGFGVLAMAMAMMGVYGVVTQAVHQRTHEFGVRLALGAGRADIFRIVLKQGLIMTLLGVGIGLAAAAGVSRLLAAGLAMIDPNDVLAFAQVGLLLTLSAIVACLIPARRATKVDPMVALRYE